MTTGYTARVKPETTPAEWLRICAHAFYYDLDFDKPLPQGRDLKHDEDRVAEAGAEVEKLAEMTLAEARVKERAAREESNRYWAEIKKKNAKEAQVFRGLLNQVLAWRAPKRLSGLKEFAVQQLEGELKQLEYKHTPMKFRPAALWLSEQREWAAGSLARAEESLAKAREQNKETAEFVATLYTEMARLAAVDKLGSK